MTNQSENKSVTWIRGTLIVGSLLLAIILGQVFFALPAVHAQLVSWKLIPAPERYTELYFDNSLKLPNTVTAKPIAFGFTIHNVTGITNSYPYTVSLVSSTGAQTLLKHGAVSVGNSVAYYVPESITLPHTTPVSEIVVSLPNQNQQIKFWLGKTQ